ncbi:MAG: tetratricopeptide repeat protein [Porticoccaceae bacterium]
MDDRAFLFILGAGASVSSGIPAGAILVERWLGELYSRLCHTDQTLGEWATEENLGISGFDYKQAARFYPQVFQRRFRDDPQEGYADLEKTMDGAQPSFGYSVLAQILDSSRHKIVVTTNFDNLVADAMAIYAGKHPLVVGHEALAGFVSDRPRRPLVAKIHRDLYFSPVNDQQGSSQLDAGWERALKHLFARYTPLVIGYGGNDGSFMDLLKAVDPIPGSLYWTYLQGDSEPDDTIRDVVARHKGKFVPILGFDEFMLQLREIFDLPDLTGQIEIHARARGQRYRKQFEQLRKKIYQPLSAATAEQAREVRAVQQAAAAFVEHQQYWWLWQLKAEAESDLNKRDAIYREGLKQFPKSPELIGNFASFMRTVRKDYDEAERLYLLALELDPSSANLTGNFASLMETIRKDYDETERLYRRALELDPSHANNTGNFAIFVADIRKDYDEAERLYRRALELDPTHAIHTGNLANFMADIREDYDEAERLYRRALELDPDHALHTGNFATFMADIREDYGAAERLYRRALELDPNDANLTGNFATFMADIRKDYGEAERLYRRTLELDPNHALHTGNFANFMAGVRKDYDAAERLYRRALELDPNDANRAGNFAKLMRTVRKDYGEAERLYHRALELDPNDATRTGNFAQLLLRYRDVDQAVEYARAVWRLTGGLNGELAGPVAFMLALAAEPSSTDSAPALARLKTVLLSGNTHSDWSFGALLAHAGQTLNAETANLYAALADAINGRKGVADLERFPRWRAIKPAAPDTMSDWD